MKSLGFSLALSSALAFAQTTPQIEQGGTVVHGKLSTIAPNVETFQGIPYAEPPINDLRFHPPVLQKSLNASEFNATSFGPSCFQPGIALNASSEDCLTINIFRPSGSNASSSLPVMFWIYGGAFTIGTSSNPLYDGSTLVNRSMARGTPILYVSINYRLGPLGFPVGKEAASRQALNLGLKDQLVGLQWVQENIGAYGGDKTKVTVFGESAGAHSIDYHLFSSSLKTSARAAILESSYRDPLFYPEEIESDWHAFVSFLPECASVANTSDTFSCLQSANISSASMFQAVTKSIPGSQRVGPGWLNRFGPVIDGKDGVIPDFPSQLKPQSVLTLMHGSNLDEGTIFTPQNVSSDGPIRDFLINGSTPSPRGPEELESATDKILELYPDTPALGSPFGTGNNTFGLDSQYKRYAAIVGDYYFQSARRYLSEIMIQQGSKVYSYHFTDHDSNLPPVLPKTPIAPGSIAVTHIFEVPYVFGLLAPFNITSSSAKQTSALMQEYWVSFATSLDPNDGKGLDRPKWEEHSSSKGVIQLGGGNATMIPDTFRKDQIAFINQDQLLFRR